MIENGKTVLFSYFPTLYLDCKWYYISSEALSKL